MLLKYPSAKDIAKSTFSKFANLLEVSSKGKIDREKAKEIRNLARKSVGVYIAAKAMELRQTIELIQVSVLRWRLLFMLKLVILKDSLLRIRF